MGWEESECHPSAAFQITLTLGNLMPAGHFPLGSVVFGSSPLTVYLALLG